MKMSKAIEVIRRLEPKPGDVIAVIIKAAIGHTETLGIMANLQLLQKKMEGVQFIVLNGNASVKLYEAKRAEEDTLEQISYIADTLGDSTKAIEQIRAVINKARNGKSS